MDFFFRPTPLFLPILKFHEPTVPTHPHYPHLRYLADFQFITFISFIVAIAVAAIFASPIKNLFSTGYLTVVVS